MESLNAKSSFKKVLCLQLFGQKIEKELSPSLFLSLSILLGLFLSFASKLKVLELNKIAYAWRIIYDTQILILEDLTFSSQNIFSSLIAKTCNEMYNHLTYKYKFSVYILKNLLMMHGSDIKVFYHELQLHRGYRENYSLIPTVCDNKQYAAKALLNTCRIINGGESNKNTPQASKW